MGYTTSLSVGHHYKGVNMNLIQSNIKTMTLKELTDLIEVRHDKAMVKVESLAKEPEFGAVSKMDIVYNERGQKIETYKLDKRQSIAVASRLNTSLLMRIIDRWQELETQAPALPQTYAEALLEAGRLAQELEVASSKLEQAKPKIEFVEKYVESTGNKGFRQVAKILGVKEPWFRTFLTDNNIMYKLGGEWTARQAHITAGRFVVKTGTSDSDHAYSTAKFTPKGVEWIAGLIAKDKASQIMKVADVKRLEA